MITVNGTDLRTLGFYLRDRELPSFRAEVSRLVAVPGSVVPAYAGGSVELRQLRVTGTMKGTDHTALLTAIDALTGHLQGELAIAFIDMPDREWIGRLRSPSSIREYNPNLLTRGATAQLVFDVLGPARAVVESQRSGNGALVLGTAPSPLRVVVVNGATAAITAFRVRVRTAAGGTVLRSLTWNGNLPVNQTLTVNSETMSVTVAGANGLGGLVATSEFPVGDPVEGGDYVDFTVTGGPAASVNAYYYQRWFR